MRGKETVNPPRLDGVRITPAYAGKSSRFTISRYRVWDHPRVCGEKRCRFV